MDSSHLEKLSCCDAFLSAYMDEFFYLDDGVYYLKNNDGEIVTITHCPFCGTFIE